MKYGVQSIETYYKGICFKSRLEARWAAFFDLCGWEWSYEPIKINNRIPDFVLSGNNCKIVVEVKPFVYLNEKMIESFFKCYDGHFNYMFILTDMPFSKSKYNTLKLCDGFDFYYSDFDEFVMKSKNDVSSQLNNWDPIFGKLRIDSRENFIEYSGNHDKIDRRIIQKNWFEAGQITKLKTY